MNKDIAYPPPQYHLTFTALSAHAACHIRRMVRTYLVMWGMPHLAEAAELAVTELLANVIKYVPDRSCTVLLLAEEGKLRVEVGDTSPAVPVKRTAQPWDESGRGLAMVELITDAWGVDRAEGAPGKKVWFELKA
ncbi:ATP-binding protein [Streptomyces sp. MK37H]|uniref:ATP-binding protein n=1 Tax=Streptomyces sp. MK37H TaxID=2699117 RepID=UPI0027E42EB1|nr:ATP-binding protein [Streptomyces sp. MK37H]MBP8537612.1 ATP-binding protein [Streptomyces sp. MK37H]